MSQNSLKSAAADAGQQIIDVGKADAAGAVIGGVAGGISGAGGGGEQAGAVAGATKGAINGAIVTSSKAATGIL